jgi:NitT/TauT family transport system ATP-binding protein
MELWQEVEATVFLVTHSIIEAVYLGDRVWIFTPAPGRIGREIAREIPYTRDVSPLEIQNRSDFKEAVELVSEEFRRIAGTDPSLVKVKRG